MIGAVFLLLDFCLSLYKNWTESKLQRKDELEAHGEYFFEIPSIDGYAYYDDENELRFAPPVFSQRYQIVSRILKEKFSRGGVWRVIDFGCSELGFFIYAKPNLGITEYFGVDIDGAYLSQHSNRVVPLTVDHLVKRNSPLRVQVLQGSVTDPDFRVKDPNAVVAIELIEHLYPEELDALPHNIFGILQPEIAVFTTPNSEFNVLFPNFTGFRHDDHKFEWTRNEFESWAANIIIRYPSYGVSFKGIGPGPEGSENLGCCSQLALFFRKGPREDKSEEYGDFYQVIREVDFPFISKEEAEENSIRQEAYFMVEKLRILDDYLKDDVIVIPFEPILLSVKKRVENCTEERLRNVLCTRYSVDKQEDGTFAVICSIYSDNEDDGRSFHSDESNFDERSFEYYGERKESFTDEEWDVNPSLSCFDMTKKDKLIDEPKPGGSGSDSPEALDKKPNGEEPKAACGRAGPSKSPVPGASDFKLLRKPIQSNDSSKTCETLVNNDPQLNVSSLPKCHSLDTINVNRNKNNSFRFSLNMDKQELMSNCDIVSAKKDRSDGEKMVKSVGSLSETLGLRLETDSCSQSKAPDSGYPNSVGQDMELDMTPEQVDEIRTESESSFDEGEESEGEAQEQAPVVPAAQFLDNVENGDVANNNRDGEGNNMEANGGAAPVFHREAAQEALMIIGGGHEEEDGAIGVISVESDEEGVSAIDTSSLGDVSHSLVSGDVFTVRGIPMPLDPGPSAQRANGLQDVLHHSSAATSNASSQDVGFPDWLLNVMVDGDNLGGGDLGSEVWDQNAIYQNVEDDDDDDDDDDDTDLEPDEVIEAESTEIIIEGDVFGGGDPPHQS